MLANRACILTAAGSMLALSTLQPAFAEDDTGYEDPVERDLMEGGAQCIRTRRIDRTRVIHDQAVLFYMRGAEIYVNVLPKPCKRLSDEGRFLYETSVARLCRGGLIRILQDNGFGMTTGRACRLGGFHPISDEQIERLFEPKTVDPRPIPPAEPESVERQEGS